MAIGKEIKVVLTLDDSGFSVKARSAREIVNALRAGLGEFVGTATKVDESIAKLSGEVEQFSKNFASIGKSLEQAVSRLNQAADSVDKFSTGAGKSARSLKEFDSTVSKLPEKLIGFVQANEKVAASIVAGQERLLLARGGFAALDEAQRKSARTSKETADAFANSRIAALRAEIDADGKIIAEREQMYRKLKKQEADFAAQALAKRVAHDTYYDDKVGVSPGDAAVRAAIMAEAESLQHRATAAGVGANSVAQYTEKIQQERAARLANIEAIKQEVVQKERFAQIAQIVGQKNKEEIERVAHQAEMRDKLRAQQARELAEAKKQAARDAARAEKDAADEAARAERAARMEQIRLAREASQERVRIARETARQEREQIQSIAQMWTGMAQAYAGAKIERGLGASVNQAAAMENERVAVSSLNLPKEEEAALIASSETMAKNLKFISVLDSIKSRMSAIASIGDNNAKTIDETLASAVKAANNLQQLGYGHGDLQSMIRNLYGVVEMRQQTADSAATNRTFDVLQKIITGTAGKVQTQDIETVLRRLGMGAAQLSDQGLINLAAIVDQFKVAGGDGGGSGGGVSTVGTAFKMMQAYALGKGLSNEAVKEFSGAGILSTSGLNLNKDSAHILRDAKHGGLKDADLWLKDPVAAVQKIMPQIVEYTKRADQRDKYYQGRDMNNFDNEMVAVSMYLARLGITTTASQALMVAGDPRSQERIHKQSETISNSKGINAVDADLQKTYSRNVQELKANLSDLAVLVGTQLLPPLNAVLSVIKDILIAGKEFAKENPITTQMSGIAAAIGGVVLSVKGFMSIFGMGGLLGVAGSLASRIGQATVATTLFGESAKTARVTWAYFQVVLGEWISKLPVLGPLLNRVGSLFGWIGSKLGLVGGMVGSTFGMLAGWILRIGSLVGWALVAWDIGQIIGKWLKDVKVGTLSIGEHIQNMFLGIEVGWKGILLSVREKWMEFLKLIGGKDQLQYEADKKELEAERKKLEQYRQFMQIRATPDTPQSDQSHTDAENRRFSNHKAPEKKRDGVSKQADDTAAQARVRAAAESGGHSGYAERVDPLTRALEEAKGKVDEQQAKLRGMVVGAQTIENLREQVIAELEGKRKAGDFNENHDKNKPVSKDNAKYQELVDVVTRQRLQTEQIKSIEFANERVAASTLEANLAMERIANSGAAKETDAFRALSRELARAEERLGAGAKGFEKWSTAKNMALFGQARSDAANFAVGYVDKNQADRAALIDTEKERIAAQLKAEREKEDKLYQMHVDTLEKTKAATIASIMQEGGSLDARVARVRDVEQQAQQARDALDAEYSERRRVRGEQEIRSLETLLDKQVREWKDAGKAIESIQSNAADNFVKMLTDGLGQGRLEFGKFAKGVLTDIANAKLKQTLADPLKQIADSSTGWLKDLFGTSGIQAAKASEAAATTQATTATSLLTVALNSAVAAVQNFSASLGAGTGTSAIGAIGGSSSFDFFGQSVDGMSYADFATAFADGGIMTNMGPLQLRKYARGGVANSPQLALFGEGDMNEAYVPLPDGRSIPVTMNVQGAQQQAAPAVTVNVINQSSQAVNAEQGQLRFDGKQYILDVVMTAVHTPGSFRNGMKEALK